MEIRIINETKNLIVTLISEQAFNNRYGEWTSSDFATRKYIAETENIFVLYGMSGFRKAPDVKDIRNEAINKNGSSRVSGHSDDLMLKIQMESLLHCFTDEQMLDLYNYPLSTFHNEFNDLLIEFDIGCQTLYQYYSFQSQTDDLSTFTFKGSRGGNTYYIKGGMRINMEWEQDLQYMTPALVKATLNNTNNNYVNDRPLHNRLIYYISNEETKFTFTIEAISPNYFPKPFIENLTLIVNEQPIYFQGKFQKIILDENGNAIDENGNAIAYSGEMPILETKKNTIEFKPQLQRGDFRCNLLVPVATVF